MLFYTKKVVAVAVVILMTIALCSANKQDVRMQFVKNKVLHTTYATKETNSELNCARWCLKDKQLGKCKMAGYNMYSKSCSLSMDNPADALDVNDEMSGIYIMEQEEGTTATPSTTTATPSTTTATPSTTTDTPSTSTATPSTTTTTPSTTTTTPSTTTATPSTTTTTPSTTTATPSTTTASPSTTTTTPLATTATPSAPTCDTEVPLVGGSNPIPDDHMTATSYLFANNKNFLPSLARLNGAPGWIADTVDTDASVKNFFLQVQFWSTSTVTAVETQGGPLGTAWTQQFRLMFSSNCVTFQPITDDLGNNKTFQGNFDGNTVVTNPLVTPVGALCLRLYPLTWNVYANVRLEVKGCPSV